MTHLDRRKVLTALASGAAACCVARVVRAEDEASGASLVTGSTAGLAPTPARWWRNAGDLRVQCELCPNQCRVADRERGTCGVRENRGGTYLTLVYGRPCALHVDPIEKKPFHHVLPGKTALSLAAPGCNLQCRFCQNWEISQVRPEQVQMFAESPRQIVKLAKRQGTPAIACTYGEPVVWAEYVYDIAAASRREGIRTLMVSNGFIEPQPMEDLTTVLGAVKIDLKAYSNDFYQKQCSGQLKPVLATLRLLAKRRVWFELVTLVIPGLNDSEAQTRALARFVRTELGSDVPLHFTRFHPTYRLTNVPDTPVATLSRARNVARAEGLHFVYVGNVAAHPGNNTYCPGCNKIVIRRVGIAVVKNLLVNGKCPNCQRAIPGIWT